MVENGHTYRYHTFPANEQGVVELGQYAQQVAVLLDALNPHDVGGLTEVEGRCKRFWAGVVITEYDSQVVAYGALRHPYTDSNEMELTEAYVAPCHRRRGIYKQLLNLRLQMAIQKGAQGVFIMLFPNSKLKNYIQSEGFKRKMTDQGIVYRNILQTSL